MKNPNLPIAIAIVLAAIILLFFKSEYRYSYIHQSEGRPYAYVFDKKTGTIYYPYSGSKRERDGKFIGGKSADSTHAANGSTR